MGSELCEEMIMEIILRSSLKTLDAMRCTSNDLHKLTYSSYFLDHYKKHNIVFGCLLQNTIRGCINIQEFASSPDSKTLDLKFLPYNAKVLACSEQGIMVFKSPNARFNMKDLYYICKPTTQQVLPLPNPKTKYTTQKVAIVVRSMNPLHYKIVRLSKPKDRNNGEILTSPAPTLECDQAGTSKQLVKYSGKLGFAFKPPNGRWEIWVLNIDHSWEKVLVFTVNQDIGNKRIKAGLL
ncbi:hypothetical protein Tco_0344105 [Tanacetum coccineum]